MKWAWSGECVEERKRACRRVCGTYNVDGDVDVDNHEIYIYIPTNPLYNHNHFVYVYYIHSQFSSFQMANTLVRSAARIAEMNEMKLKRTAKHRKKISMKIKPTRTDKKKKNSGTHRNKNVANQKLFVDSVR